MIAIKQPVYSQSNTILPAGREFELGFPEAKFHYSADSCIAPAVKSTLKVLPFAYSLPAAIRFPEDAECITIGNEKIYRIAIISTNAKSLYLELDNLFLKSSERLFFMDNHFSKVIGPVTSRQLAENGEFAISPVPGDTAILEIRSFEDSPPSFRVSKVYHDYLGVISDTNDKDGTFGLSESCEIDVNCYEGTDWQREKRSVCRIITNGQLCSGTLINNTRNDGRPFILTANHCISTENQANNSIFYFNYESPSCYGIDGSAEEAISWSHLHATTYHLDFALLEMVTAPPPSFLPYYAGLELSDTPPQSATVIHHPQGDVKKISRELNSLPSANYGSGYDYDSHWKITTWDLGTTEGGSSGSPIFNDNHLITGTLTGGEASCSFLMNDYFSKIHLAWDEYPGTNQQLKYWLDPDSSLTGNLLPYEPYSLQTAPSARISSDKIHTLTGRTIDFTDLSTGNPTTWLWEFEGAYPSSSSEQNPQDVLYYASGKFDVKLTVFNAFGQTSTIFQEMVWVDETCFEDFSHLLAVYGSGLETIESGNGYWTGNNDQGITEFADKRQLSMNEYWIHRISFTPGLVKCSQASSSVRIKIWAGGSFPQNLLYAANIPLQNLIANQINDFEFPEPVLNYGNFYIGYSLHLAEGDSFAMKQSHFAPVESSYITGYNSLFVKNISNWYPLNSVNPAYGSSLDMKAYLCRDINAIEFSLIDDTIEVFPNPTADYIRISGELPNEIKELALYDLQGNRMNIPIRLTGTDNLINISSLPTGIYILRIHTGKDVVSKKIIKL